SGARTGFPGRRIVAAFQPHRFTRTRDQFDEFAVAFNDADAVLVTDVFPAGEQPIPGIEAARLAQAMRDHGHRDVTYVPRPEDVPPAVARTAEPGDIVITLGAGDIHLTCQELLALLKGEARAAGGAP